MPRSGSGVYSKPSGTAAVPNATITSSQFNTTIDDLVVDLNYPRPIASGGTGAANVADARAALGLAIGTNVQAFDAGLLSIAGLTTAADRMIYTTASDVYATTALTPFARTILDDVDAATMRATLGANSASNLTTGTVPVARLPSIPDTLLPATMAGKTFTDVIVVRGLVPRIDLIDTDAASFFIRVDAGDFYVLTDRDSSGTWETPHPLLLRNADAAGYIYGSLVWTAANDGPTSGLDADTVDGVHLAGLVQTSRTITAGNGLTGLGDLSANRSVAVGAGTGITVGATTVSVDGTVWRDGSMPTAAQIGGIIAGLTQGSIGSYAMAIKKTAGTINPGTTVAGTDLYWSNAANSAAVGIDVGTWRAMGIVTNAAASLLERIS